MQNAAVTRPFHTLLVLAAALFAALALPGLARGQGTDGLVPDPISSKELREYAERLDLTREQLLALSELHVGYREKYRELRYGEIRDLFSRAEEFEPMQMPEVKEVKEVIDMRRRILSAIEDLDRAFFEDMATVLNESQRQQMPRILRAREKQRYSFPFDSELGRVDLVKLLDEMELSEAEERAVDGVLQQYEIASASSARNFHDEGINLILSMLRKLEEMGIDEDSFNDPMGMMATLTTIETALKETGKDLQNIITDQRQETRRYMRQIGEALTPARAEQFEQAYLEAAYPRIYPDRRTAAPMIRASLALEDLDENQRLTLSDMQQRFAERHRRVSEELRALVDERFATIISVDPTGWDEFSRNRRELRDKRNDLNEETRESIKQLLTEDQHARAERQATRLAGPGHRIYRQEEQTRTVTYETSSGETVVVEEGSGDPDAAASVETVAVERRERQQAVSLAHIGPITSSNVNDMAQLLRLDRTQRQAAHALHEDYLDRFQTLREQREEPLLREPQSRVYGEDRSINVSAMDAVHRGRQQFREAVAELDDDYFFEVEMLLSPEQAARLDLARLERRLAVLGERGARFFTPISNEGNVNLIELVGALPLSDAEFDAAIPVLREYAEETLPHKQSAYDAALEQGDLWQRVRAETQAETPGQWMDMAEKVRERGKPLREQADQAREAMLDIQQQALVKLQGTLPGSQAATFLRNFYETAYPDVYPDPTAADPVFDEAMSLRDLTTPQYESLQAAFDRYADEHGRICGRMIEAARNVQLAGQNWFDPETQRERGRHERLLETLRFDREELNALYRMRIEAILTPQQVEKMRTLRGEE